MEPHRPTDLHGALAVKKEELRKQAEKGIELLKLHHNDIFTHEAVRDFSRFWAACFSSVGDFSSQRRGSMAAVRANVVQLRSGGGDLWVSSAKHSLRFCDSTGAARMTKSNSTSSCVFRWQRILIENNVRD